MLQQFGKKHIGKKVFVRNHNAQRIIDTKRAD